MNHFGHKKAFAVVFIAAVFVYMVIAFCSFGQLRAEAELKAASNTQWSAAEAYPFQTDAPQSTASQSISPITQATILINNFKVSAKSLTTSNNLFYSDIAVLRKIIDRDVYGYNATTSLSGTENDLADPRDLVVLHESGFLSFVYDNTDTAKPLENLQQFNQYLSQQDIDLLLFIPPCKTGALDASYRGTYQDYGGQLLNEIVQQAQIRGIDTINFQQIADEQSLTEEQLYFRTDHHWLPQSGLLGCQAISSWLTERGYDVDFRNFDLDQYNVNYVQYPMLGSQGIKVTSAYTEVEYMPILEPLYETDLTVANFTSDTVLTGSIPETLYDYTMVQEPSLDSPMHYQFYSYGDQPLLQIHNNQRTDGKRILVIKDSFARVMIPYMCNMAEYVDVIDLRHFDGSLKTYLAEHTPDSVIVVYAVGTFVDQHHYTAPTQYAFNFE